MMRSVVVSICDSFSVRLTNNKMTPTTGHRLRCTCCTISASAKIAIMPPASRISRTKPDHAETAQDNAER
jgi:hypothetical protein